MGTRIAPALHGSVGAVGPVGSDLCTASHQRVVTDHNAPCLRGADRKSSATRVTCAAESDAALVPPGAGSCSPTIQNGPTCRWGSSWAPNCDANRW